MPEVYLIARNAGGRPTLQHLAKDGHGEITACGVNVSAWSRSFSDKPILEVLCMRDACREKVRVR